MGTGTQRIQRIIQSVNGNRSMIGLDTNCVQYYLGGVKPWADCLYPIFQAATAGNIELYISTVVMSEVLAHAHHANRDQTGYDSELSLMEIFQRNFTILDVNQEIAKKSGVLRADHAYKSNLKKLSLKTPDAIIGATSLTYSHTLLITNDLQLANALPSSNCIYLKDLALEWLETRFPQVCIADSQPIELIKTSSGISGSQILASELCGIKPDVAVTWNCILTDAFITASALNEPCIFFLLINNGNNQTVVDEMLFWHDGLSQKRTIKKTIKYIIEFLEYKFPKGGKQQCNPDKEIYIFCFSSLNREFTRQAQPNFASKTPQQKKSEAWKSYLLPFWQFKEVLSLPNVTWILGEDGIARKIDHSIAFEFISHARNVLGWEDK